MSDTMRYTPDCSYCLGGIRHSIRQHGDSIALAARWIRMQGEREPEPEPESIPTPVDLLKLRRAFLRRRVADLSDCIEHLETNRPTATGLEFLHREVEIARSQIAAIESELEVRG